MLRKSQFTSWASIASRSRRPIPRTSWRPSAGAATTAGGIPDDLIGGYCQYFPW